MVKKISRQGCRFAVDQALRINASVGREEKAPAPMLSVLLRERPVLPRPDVVLTKDRKWPYEGQFCGKIDREGFCSKAAGGP